MKKILLILIFCTSILLLTGCWDRKEINDISIVDGVSLDKKGELIELSAQIAIPRAMGGGQHEGGGGGMLTMVRTGEGETITDALAKLQEKLPRRVFWGHTKVIVIGEKLAKNGIRKELDFFVRHPQPSFRSYAFISKGRAKDMLQLSPPLERSSSEVLRELAISQNLMKVNLKDLLLMLIGDEGAAALPMIDISPPEKGQKELQTIAYINRTAIFKKDKMIGDIDDYLTRGVLWIRNEIKNANMTVKPKGANGPISVMLLHSNTELIPKIEDGKWKMTVKILTENDLIQNASQLNSMNPAFTKLIEAELGEYLKRRIQLALQQVQNKKKADILGFAGVFHGKYPKEWNKVKDHWDEIFPTVEVTLDTRINLRRPGKATTPQGLPETEVKNK
ncbi:Ger(x)C family spore germination protein [Paenibacillus alginolyticus]|uniref:Ger(X)C family spore germination protein n=1 Tax=Paenibacillus alginolyticus TaxID=59839 RepID=A0ABT4GGX9_9BACL|nr:Ger(x)C family spore germination protein [Paenibacillus alginolyticus]MCY9695447.1 Ger(x)C family spore germination protein [Paenibacillus alginolyticus]MEC0146308.1 Ger(x)C family spore germination protein [Paenibacillus alginolyticus]